MGDLSNAEERAAIVKKAIDALSEHFGNVQIFCSTVEDGETFQVRNGHGNQFARLGQCQDWIDWHRPQTQKDAVDEISEE